MFCTEGTGDMQSSDRENEREDVSIEPWRLMRNLSLGKGEKGLSLDKLKSWCKSKEAPQCLAPFGRTLGTWYSYSIQLVERRDGRKFGWKVGQEPVTVWTVSLTIHWNLIWVSTPLLQVPQRPQRALWESSLSHQPFSSTYDCLPPKHTFVGYSYTNHTLLIFFSFFSGHQISFAAPFHCNT